MRKTTKRGTAAVVLAATAIVVPTASAQPIDPPLPAPTASAKQIDQPLPGLGFGQPPVTADTGSAASSIRTVEDPSSGFDWGDASLGAAGMLSLLGLGTGAVVVARRSRGHSRPATTS